MKRKSFKQNKEIPTIKRRKKSSEHLNFLIFYVGNFYSFGDLNFSIFFLIKEKVLSFC